VPYVGQSTNQAGFNATHPKPAPTVFQMVMTRQNQRAIVVLGEQQEAGLLQKISRTICNITLMFVIGR
jgi:hypothetical protein